jgi:hypothetical protein
MATTGAAKLAIGAGENAREALRSSRAASIL